MTDPARIASGLLEEWGLVADGRPRRTHAAVVQPVLLGLAVVPIWRTAREVARLRLGVTVALSLAYAAAPILYTANLSGWSAVVPAVPALAWASWFGHRRRWVAYGLCLLVAVASRADVGLVLVASTSLVLSASTSEFTAMRPAKPSCCPCPSRLPV